MKKFNSDEKMLVLMELEPRETIIVCEQNEDMNKLCKSKNYELMWQKKIEKDFGIEGDKGGYERYKFLKQLNETKLYIVLSENYDGRNIQGYIFETRDKAEKFIFYTLNETFGNDPNYSYSKIKPSLDRGYLNVDDDWSFSIVEDTIHHYEDMEKFRKVEKLFISQKEEYEKTKKPQALRGFNIISFLTKPMQDFLLNTDFGTTPSGVNIRELIADAVSKGYLTRSIVITLMTIYLNMNGLKYKIGNETYYKVNDELRKYFGPLIDKIEAEDAGPPKYDKNGNIIEGFKPEKFKFFDISRIFNGTFIKPDENQQKFIRDNANILQAYLSQLEAKLKM